MIEVNKYCTLLNEKREEYLVSNGYTRVEEEKTKINQPDLLADFINKAYMANSQPVEKVWLVCINNKMEPTGSFELSVGDVRTAIVNSREVFKAALMSGAVNIAIAHNHPSGDPDPSKEDCETTKKLFQAGLLLGIPLLDHVIIGEGNKWYSFRQSEPDIFKTNKNR